MMKLLVSIYILTTLLLVGAGCTTSDEYCCESNDFCDPVGEDLYSCSAETCQCVLVQPIVVAVDGEWKHPMVGQDNYRVKLQATGGLTPHTWKDFTIVGDTGGKLSWLTLQVDDKDPSKAYLTNRVKNDVTLTPSEEAAIGENLKIRVTVLDNSKHGTKEQRVDNVGYLFEHEIMIKPSKCENGDGFCPTTPISCNISTDNDCPITCGDGIVSSGEETCDTAIPDGQDGACPTSCIDNTSCTTDTLENAGTCQAVCTHSDITTCKDGDSCCPVGCNSSNDDNCSFVCGDGLVHQGETCDKAIAAGEVGACPTSCDDGDECTSDTLNNPDTCQASCSYSSIKTCTTGGGCCPPSIEGIVYNMKYVPGGTFPTGVNDAGDINSDGTNESISPATVGEFWIGETEVTYELWNAVYSKASVKGYTFANTGTIGSSGSGSQQQPVTTVNWRDAMVWCNLASELAELTPVYYTDEARTNWIKIVDKQAVSDATKAAGQEDNPYVKEDADGFRLPGMWQWECAARYKNGTDWTPGNYASGATADYHNKDANDQVAVYGSYWNGSTWIATGVTSTDVVKNNRTANALGIYDMSGNVREWCFEWRPPLYIGSQRVIRGGSWDYYGYYLQVGYVLGFAPYSENDYIGFRIMRTK